MSDANDRSFLLLWWARFVCLCFALETHNGKICVKFPRNSFYSHNSHIAYHDQHKCVYHFDVWNGLSHLEAGTGQIPVWAGYYILSSMRIGMISRCHIAFYYNTHSLSSPLTLCLRGANNNKHSKCIQYSYIDIISMHERTICTFCRFEWTNNNRNIIFEWIIIATMTCDTRTEFAKKKI